MSWLDVSDAKEMSFELMPAGIYNMTVIESEETLTLKGDKRLKVTFAVTDGEFIGRRIYDGWNLTGSEKAVNMGHGKIKQLLAAAGKPFQLDGPEDLMNIEISASVKIQPGKDGYDAKNVISTFKPKTKSFPKPSNGSDEEIPF